MTTEEAIKILETGVEFPNFKHTADDVDEACKMAIAAFRAQQTLAKLDRSRWEGCDYCNDPSPHRDCVLPDGTEQFLCSKDGLFGDCYINERRIHFCPMCGCPITEEAWTELERRLNDGAVDRTMV